MSSQHGSYLPPEKVIQEGQPEAKMSFMTLTSEVTHYHFCKMLLETQVNPAQCGTGPQKGINAGREGSLGATLKASYPHGTLSHRKFKLLE